MSSTMSPQEVFNALAVAEESLEKFIGETVSFEKKDYKISGKVKKIVVTKNPKKSGIFLGKLLFTFSLKDGKEEMKKKKEIKEVGFKNKDFTVSYGDLRSFDWITIF